MLVSGRRGVAVGMLGALVVFVHSSDGTLQNQASTARESYNSYCKNSGWISAIRGEMGRS
jgi:hypothetical protein